MCRPQAPFPCPCVCVCVLPTHSYDARLLELQGELASIDAEQRSLDLMPESANSRDIRRLDDAVKEADGKLEAAR